MPKKPSSGYGKQTPAKPRVKPPVKRPSEEENKLPVKPTEKEDEEDEDGKEEKKLTKVISFFSFFVSVIYSSLFFLQLLADANKLTLETPVKKV